MAILIDEQISQQLDIAQCLFLCCLLQLLYRPYWLEERIVWLGLRKGERVQYIPARVSLRNQACQAGFRNQADCPVAMSNLLLIPVCARSRQFHCSDGERGKIIQDHSN